MASLVLLHIHTVIGSLPGSEASLTEQATGVGETAPRGTMSQTLTQALLRHGWLSCLTAIGMTGELARRKMVSSAEKEKPLMSPTEPFEV